MRQADPSGAATRGARTLRLALHEHEPRREQFLRDAIAWFAEGHLHYREDVVEGLERAPQHFCRLMRGENFGKALVMVPGGETGKTRPDT
jgi:NADPH-dependent curcumin reductase CurA